MKKRKQIPTPEFLNEWFKYDAESGRFTWRKSPNRNLRVGSRAGTITNHGYIHIRVDGRIYLAHRLAWVMIYGVQPPDLLDHIDRNPSNNAIANLRESSPAKNRANSAISKTRNTSGFRGVYIPKATAASPRPWFAHIFTNGKYEFLGTFPTREEARDVYDKRAKEIWGEHYAAAI